MYRGEKLAEIVLSVPGEHNIYNALAAAAAAHTLGVSPEDIAKSLHAFTGVHRRFEVLGNPSGIMVADDFPNRLAFGGFRQSLVYSRPGRDV